MHGPEAPSAWVVRFAPLIAQGARVLDLACGAGRHARYLTGARAAQVTAVDRDPLAIDALKNLPNITPQVLDLEGDRWPLEGKTFDAVIVTNYLWRPRFDDVMACVATDGVLIYETFMVGNEAYGKPSRADFLLQPNELLTRVNAASGQGFRVVAFEQGVVALPKPAVVQRIVAVRAALGNLSDLP